MPAFRRYPLLVSLVLAVVIVAAPVVLAADEATTEDAAQTDQFTVADVIELALTNSSSMALQALSVKEAELNLKAAQVNLNVTYTQQQLEDAQAALDSAQAQAQLAKQATALAASERYINVIKAQHTLTLAKANAEQATRQLTLVKERQSAGMATDNDIYLAESNLRQAQLAERQAQAGLAQQQIQFNQLVGRDIKAPFTLVDDVTGDAPQADLERDTETALSSRLDVQVLTKKVELAQRNLDAADPRYTPQAQIDRLQMALERAQIALEQAQVSVVLEVRSSITALETASIKADLAEDALEYQQKQLQVATLRHDSGLITTAELLDTQVAANAAQVAAVQGVYDVELAVARYLNAIGTGYTVSAEK